MRKATEHWQCSRTRVVVVGAAEGNSSRGTRPIVYPTQQPFHREELKICGFRSLLYPKRAVQTLLGVGGLFFSLS